MEDMVKVRYSLILRNSYGGTIEMKKSDFEELNNLDDDDLGEFLLDKITSFGDFESCDIQGVDKFQVVE